MLFTTDIFVNNKGNKGVLVNDGNSVKCINSTITGNSGGDLILSFGSRATLNGNTIGTLPIFCDGTVLSRGDHLCP